MEEKKNKIIGIRFTKEEKKNIEKFAEKKNYNMTDLVRLAVYDYIYNDKEIKEQLNLGNIVYRYNHIKSYLNKVFKNMAELDKELQPLLEM